MLEVTNVRAGYGPVDVLHGIDMTIPTGEITSVVGPNGAGKTTLARVISGLLRPTSGEVTVDGKRLTGLKPHAVVRAGVSQVPEGAGVFRELTVKDNLLLAGRKLDAAQEVLGIFPRLAERIDNSAASLSGGERQMLGIARALLLDPKILILDEPSFGLAPALVAEVFEQLVRIVRERDMGVLLVEQNIEQSLRISTSAHVLEGGTCVMSGSAAELLADERTREQYLALG